MISAGVIPYCCCNQGDTLTCSEALAAFGDDTAFFLICFVDTANFGENYYGASFVGELSRTATSITYSNPSGGTFLQPCDDSGPSDGSARPDELTVVCNDELQQYDCYMEGRVWEDQGFGGSVVANPS